MGRFHLRLRNRLFRTHDPYFRQRRELTESANRVLTNCSKQPHYAIPSSARTSSAGGISSPSVELNHELEPSTGEQAGPLWQRTEQYRAAMRFHPHLRFGPGRTAKPRAPRTPANDRRCQNRSFLAIESW